MPFVEPFKALLTSGVTTIRDINRKYSQPRIKITPMVSFALLMLRCYLILLVGILIYKFIVVLRAR
jgi:hypothetical protein